jgi:hypothetical protein
MTALNLQDIDPEHIPEEVKQAGAFIASVAAAGNLYQQKTDSGVVTSKSVEADDVKVSRTFAELSTTSSSTELLDPDLQLALDMLKPWMINPFQTFFVRRDMSDLKVVPFQKPSHHNLDNDQVIRLLKQALEQSRKRRSSVAVILLDDEGNAIDCRHNGGRPGDGWRYGVA